MKISKFLKYRVNFVRNFINRVNGEGLKQRLWKTFFKPGGNMNFNLKWGDDEESEKRILYRVTTSVISFDNSQSPLFENLQLSAS